jgi:hypothetical protein
MHQDLCTVKFHKAKSSTSVQSLLPPIDVKLSCSPSVSYLPHDQSRTRTESQFDIDPVLEHTGGGGAPVLAEFLTAVGALEGFVVGVKRAVGTLKVFLAAEG